MALNPGHAIWLLALGQTLTYSGVYYAFPALLPDIEAWTGWTKAQLALGPTLAFLVMAPLTPLTGRLVDRGLGGEMLVVLPALAAAALAGLTQVATPAGWVLLWLVIGVAMSGCLYETCFAFLVRRLGAAARPAITRVTLVAGLAGTLTFPLADIMARTAGAPGALAGFAALMLAGAVPANLLAVRILRAGERAEMQPPPASPGAIRAAAHRPAFWAIAAIYGLIWLNHGMLLTYVLDLFEAQGASAGAATLAAASIGPAQVLGRFVLMRHEARIGNRLATNLSLASVLVAAVVLWAAGLAPWLVFLTAATQGAGVGVLSILRPVLIVEHLGHAGFGGISGVIAVAPILATAGAPVIGAWLLAAGGPGLVQLSCGLCALGGLAVWAALAARAR